MPKVLTEQEVTDIQSMLQAQGDNPLYVRDGHGVSVVLTAWEPKPLTVPSYAFYRPTVGHMLTAYADGTFGNGPIEGFNKIDGSETIDDQFAGIIGADNTRRYLAQWGPKKKDTMQTYYVAKELR